MNLRQQAESVRNRRDFWLFVEELLKQYESEVPTWEANIDPKTYRTDEGPNWGRNIHLASYLEAISSSACAIDSVYENQNEPFPKRATWRVFAEILLMATDYE